jgi:hypothetical protein
MKRTFVSPELGMRGKSNETPSQDPFHKDVEKDDSKAHKAKVAKAGSRTGRDGHFATMAERVAKHHLYYLNHKIPDAEKHFPVDIYSRFVSKYFPYAEGGPLYVDEPRNDDEMFKAYEKQKVLKKMGLRSIVIMRAEKFKDLETAFCDCLEQLGEL